MPAALQCLPWTPREAWRSSLEDKLQEAKSGGPERLAWTARIQEIVDLTVLTRQAKDRLYCHGQRKYCLGGQPQWLRRVRSSGIRKSLIPAKRNGAFKFFVMGLDDAR